MLSNYVFQRSLAQRELLNRQISQRETLYSDFIKEASSAYADSMTHGLETPDELVCLYALVSRIRLLARRSRFLRQRKLFSSRVGLRGKSDGAQLFDGHVWLSVMLDDLFSASLVGKSYRKFFAAVQPHPLSTIKSPGMGVTLFAFQMPRNKAALFNFSVSGQP